MNNESEARSYECIICEANGFYNSRVKKSFAKQMVFTKRVKKQFAKQMVFTFYMLFTKQRINPGIGPGLR